MRIYVLAITLFSLQALADCPKLTGEFQCVYDDQSWDVSFTQATSETGVTTYYDKGETYAITDRIVREVPDTADFKNGFRWATCKDNGLEVGYRGDLFNEDEKQGSMRSRVRNHLGKNDDLVQRHQGSYLIGGNEYPFDVIVTCRRLH